MIFMAEGGGIEPLRLITAPWFSGPVADHSAAPSIGGECQSRTGSGVNLYGLANRCIAVLPTLQKFGGHDWHRTCNRRFTGALPYQLSYTASLIPSGNLTRAFVW